VSGCEDSTTPTLKTGRVAVVHKHFSKRDHAKYDEVARETAKTFWSRLGWNIDDNPDEYGVDLIAEKDSKRVYVEVEVKRGWHGPTFQYDTMHLPLRKRKFLDKPTKFMIFNNSLTHAAVISRKAIKNAPVSVVPNQKVSIGEKFFDIPVDDVTFVYTM
jgi:hypothetical protein